MTWSSTATRGLTGPRRPLRRLGGFGSLASSIPLGFSAGRPLSPFSRAISARWAATVRSRAATLLSNSRTSAFSSVGESASRSPGGAIPPGNQRQERRGSENRAAATSFAAGTRAWRLDDGRRGMALTDAGVNAILVVRAVTRKRGHRPCYLVEQGTGLGAVIPVVVGQPRGDDLASVGIHADVEFFPGPSRPGAMFLQQPLAGPTQLQPRAVHQQMRGLGIAPSLGVARPWPGHLQRRGPAAQGCVIRLGKAGAEQADEGADQALCLAQRQAEHGPEGEGCQDRQGRVPGLSAPGRAGFGRPRSDRLSGEPDRQAPTLTQAGVIGRPVRDLVLLPGDVVAAGLVQLEGQREHPKSEVGRSPTPPRLSAPTNRPADPCNTAPYAPSRLGR